jgi:hypothetical protein
MSKQEWIALFKKLNAMPLSSKLILASVIAGLIVINWAPTLIFHQQGQNQSNEQEQQ